jgi:hypothetical protein
MENQPTTAAATRAEIRKEIDRFLAHERELTERAAAMFASGNVDRGPRVNERGQTLRDRARAMLNGHGGLLPNLPKQADGPSEADVLFEREAVRLVLATLSRADVEAETVEAVERAEQLKGPWLALLRDWTLTAARFTALEARVAKFREEAGIAQHALPLTELSAGRCCGIVDYAARPGTTFDEIIEQALRGGAVTAGELRKARSA